MKGYACLYFPAGLSTDRLASLAESCWRYSSQIAVRAEEAVLLETGKSRWLYRQAGLEARLNALAKREQGLCRVRFGASPAEALALARYAMEDALGLPLEALGDYASPFVADEGARQLALSLGPPLRALGLSTLGGLLGLPLHSLGSRFGPQAPLLRHRVAGHWDMGWPRYEKKEQPSEALQLTEEGAGGCESVEQLGFGLRLLCERLCARLRGRNERVGRLRLQLSLDVFPRREATLLHWDLDLPLALGEARELYRVLHDALERWLERGLPGPALAAALTALELAPAQSGQRNFFEKREEEVEAFNAVVNRLRERLGPDQVFLAECVQRYLPERAWKKVLKELAAQNTAIPELPLLAERPTRLLPQPRPLLRADEQLMLAKGRRWKTTQWQGPERLQGEWWRGAGFGRDYYRVSIEDGPDLWVYQVLDGSASASETASAGYWLHGYFD